MISVDRVKTILECYGGQPSAWPVQERNALQQAILGSSDLQALQQEAIELDQFMGFLKVKESSVDRQILNNCSQQILNAISEPSLLVLKSSNKKQGILKGLIRSPKEKYSRPFLIAATILLAVMTLSSNQQYLEPKTSTPLSLSDYLAIYVIENESKENNLNNSSEELEILAFLEPELLEEGS